jgi:ankyrin repeat protein
MTPSNTPEANAFFKAIASGNKEDIRALVREKPDILDCFDYRNFGATPLTMTCFSNRPEIVELLIELGADPNKKSDWHMGPWSPLHCAIFRGDDTLAKFLLDHGAMLDVHTAAGLGDGSAVSRLLDAEPSRVLERGGDGCHPLHFAGTIEAAQLLLDRGAEIDGRCVDHYSTPVQYLCSTRPAVARHLLSVGAKPDIFSSVTCGDERSFDDLLNSEPNLIHARINQTFFPPGNEHDVHNILTFAVGFDATPMHAAAKANRHEMVTQLASRGLSPNVRGGYDHGTPLHTAAWHNCPQSTKALLDQGADVEARSGKLHNNTPAGWAIVAGAAEVFELLMDCGAHCHSWFIDDARDACAGRFDMVTNAPQEKRQRILSRL